MSVRAKLFGAMSVLVLLMALAYLGSTQGYLRHHLPKLVSAIADHADRSDPDWPRELERQKQDVYDNMVYVAFKVVGALSVFALLVGYGLSRMLTSPLNRLTAAIGRIGQGDLSTAIPVTTKDEYGQVAEALNWLAASLARSEEVRKHLVADVAHELRTPLTILQGKLELVQQSGQAVAPETLLPMQDELIRLRQLVNDLHQLSLAEAGKLPLDRQPTDMRELLNKLLELLRSEAEEEGIELDFPRPAVEGSVLADPHRMTQVFYNLLGNALRHTPAGGKIAIRLTENAENRHELAITIQDTGTGIPAQHLPYLFDRFYRADDDRSRHGGGMGLGLAITKQFVELHGGRIEVVSEEGEGTTFTVLLPRG